jgi:hypothetical protein
MSAGRKVFHCAVDETALTTNISEIKKWTTNGAITLVVPLYSKHLLTLILFLTFLFFSFLFIPILIHESCFCSLTPFVQPLNAFMD